MINEERVKQLYKIAIYEQTEENKHRQVGQYYRGDYIGKEIIKSFFTGTIAYLFLVLLWAMSNWEAVLASITDLTIFNTVIEILVLYVGFLALYLFATLIVYLARYNYSKKRLEVYKENLKGLNQMYEREEKLKM